MHDAFIGGIRHSDKMVARRLSDTSFVDARRGCFARYVNMAAVRNLLHTSGALLLLLLMFLMWRTATSAPICSSYGYYCYNATHYMNCRPDGGSGAGGVSSRGKSSPRACPRAGLCTDNIPERCQSAETNCGPSDHVCLNATHFQLCAETSVGTMLRMGHVESCGPYMQCRDDVPVICVETVTIPLAETATEGTFPSENESRVCNEFGYYCLNSTHYVPCINGASTNAVERCPSGGECAENNPSTCAPSARVRCGSLGHICLNSTHFGTCMLDADGAFYTAEQVDMCPVGTLCDDLSAIICNYPSHAPQYEDSGSEKRDTGNSDEIFNRGGNTSQRSKNATRLPNHPYEFVPQNERPISLIKSQLEIIESLQYNGSTQDTNQSHASTFDATLSNTTNDSKIVTTDKQNMSFSVIKSTLGPEMVLQNSSYTVPTKQENTSTLDELTLETTNRKENEKEAAKGNVPEKITTNHANNTTNSSTWKVLSVRNKHRNTFSDRTVYVNSTPSGHMTSSTNVVELTTESSLLRNHTEEFFVDLNNTAVPESTIRDEITTISPSLTEENTNVGAKKNNTQEFSDLTGDDSDARRIYLTVTDKTHPHTENILEADFSYSTTVDSVEIVEEKGKKETQSIFEETFTVTEINNDYNEYTDSTTTVPTETRIAMSHLSPYQVTENRYNESNKNITCVQTGNFPHPNGNVSLFYSCLGTSTQFVVDIYACPSGSVFDPTSNQCILSELNRRTEKSHDVNNDASQNRASSSVRCDKAGKFPSPSGNCSQFYVCMPFRSTFILKNLICPGGNEFNSQLMRCTRPEKANCNIKNKAVDFPSIKSISLSNSTDEATATSDTVSGVTDTGVIHTETEVDGITYDVTDTNTEDSTSSSKNAYEIAGNNTYGITEETTNDVVEDTIDNITEDTTDVNTEDTADITEIATDNIPAVSADDFIEVITDFPTETTTYYISNTINYVIKETLAKPSTHVTKNPNDEAIYTMDEVVTSAINDINKNDITNVANDITDPRNKENNDNKTMSTVDSALASVTEFLLDSATTIDTVSNIDIFTPLETNINSDAPTSNNVSVANDTTVNVNITLTIDTTIVDRANGLGKNITSTSTTMYRDTQANLGTSVDNTERIIDNAATSDQTLGSFTHTTIEIATTSRIDIIEHNETADHNSSLLKWSNTADILSDSYGSDPLTTQESTNYRTKPSGVGTIYTEGNYTTSTLTSDNTTISPNRTTETTNNVKNNIEIIPSEVTFDMYASNVTLTTSGNSTVLNKSTFTGNPTTPSVPTNTSSSNVFRSSSIMNTTITFSNHTTANTSDSIYSTQVPISVTPATTKYYESIPNVLSNSSTSSSSNYTIALSSLETPPFTFIPPFVCSSAGKFPNPNDNTTYYICSPRFGGGLHTMLFSCPHESKYFPSLGQCASVRWMSGTATTAPHKARLVRRSIDAYAHVARVPTQRGFICRSAGRFPDPHACDRYYVCIRRKDGRFAHIPLHCSVGTSFDSKKGMCHHTFACGVVLALHG